MIFLSQIFEGNLKPWEELSSYGHPKNEPKVLRSSPSFFNFNQFHNCLINKKLC